MVWQVIKSMRSCKESSFYLFEGYIYNSLYHNCIWTLLSIKFIVRVQRTYRTIGDTKSNKLHGHGKTFPPQHGQLGSTNYTYSIVTQQLTRDDTNLSGNLLSRPPILHYPQSSKTVLYLTINEFFLCFWLPFLAWKKLWYVFKSSVLSRQQNVYGNHFPISSSSLTFHFAVIFSVSTSHYRLSTPVSPACKSENVSLVLDV